MYKVKTLRATIFCAPIRFSRKFLDGLAGVLDNYMPMIEKDGGVLPSFPVWQLTSPDEKEVLVFTGEKIDYVKVVEGEVDNEGLETFIKRGKEVLGKVMALTGDACTRVAFAPSVIVAENGRIPAELVRRLYGICEFEGAELDSSNLSQVYRINKPLEGKNVKVNCFANFHIENDLMAVGGINQIRVRYICDFDINTMVNPDNKFTVSGMNEFYNMVSKCFEKFYKLYFG